MGRFRMVRSASLLAVLATLALGLPAVAATTAVTWTPPATRVADQPRTCDMASFEAYPNSVLSNTATSPYSSNLSSNCISASGGAFTDGEHALAQAVNAVTNAHYLYAMSISDHPGNELAPIVQYGPGGPGSNGNCTRTLNPNENYTGVTASELGTTATFVTSVTHAFVPGDQVVINGMSVTGYNGTWTITGIPSTTSFTATLASGLGAGTGGTATAYGYCSRVFFSRSATSTSVRSTTPTYNQPVTTASCGPTTGGTAYSFATYTVANTTGIVAGTSIQIFSTGTGAASNWDYSGPVTSVPTSTTIKVDLAQYMIKCKGFSAPATGALTATTYPWAWDGGGVSSGANYGADAFPVSQQNMHVEGAAMAASGAFVYVVWQTTVGYYKAQCNGDPRPIYIRINSNYGAADAWGPITPLTSTSERDGYPDIAATGTNVYVAYTKSDTGDIQVASSSNNGGTWTTKTVGHTSKVYDGGVMSCTTPANAQWGTNHAIEGYDGFPAIATGGTNVGIEWEQGCSPKTATADAKCLANGGDGRLVAKISTNSGASWPGGGVGSACASGGTQNCTQVLALNGAGGVPGACSPADSTVTVDGVAGTNVNYNACTSNVYGIAADATRIGFAWTNANPTNNPMGVYYREWSASTGWAPPSRVSCFNTVANGGCAGPGGLAYTMGYAPAIAFYGTTGVGITWVGCPTPLSGTTPCAQDLAQTVDPGEEILYKVSGNDGVTWSDGCVAGTSCSSFYVAANNNWNSNTSAGLDLNSQINEYPNLIYDNPAGASTLGCGQNATPTTGLPTGLPASGCNAYIYYIGRDGYYQWYRMYLQVGTQR